ncbi:unnamed protein product, partial [Didymodactylos carnosus]
NCFHLRTSEKLQIIKPEVNVSSIIDNTNGFSLKKQFESGDKLLCNGEADITFEKLGIYIIGDPKTSEVNALLCTAFDGISNTTRTTCSTVSYIEHAKLSIPSGTTGAKFTIMLTKFVNKIDYEGLHNGFTFYTTEEVEGTRLQHLRLLVKDPAVPSLTHLLTVVHCFGNVVYQFEKNDFDNEEGSLNLRRPINYNDDRLSAHFILFNRVADHFDTCRELSNSSTISFSFSATDTTEAVVDFNKSSRRSLLKTSISTQPKQRGRPSLRIRSHEENSTEKPRRSSIRLPPIVVQRDSVNH